MSYFSHLVNQTQITVKTLITAMGPPNTGLTDYQTPIFAGE
jgi:hypothetical protein